MILAEANVEPEQLLEYFGDGDRLPMLFNFILNQRLSSPSPRAEAGTDPASAGRDAARSRHRASGRRSCATTTRSTSGGWPATSTTRCSRSSGRIRTMQLYGRGIRRRLAPMLGNDRRRIEMAYALQFTLPGTPVIRYGDEIGMGEDLRSPNATPSAPRCSGAAGPPRRLLHRAASKRDLRRPVIAGGEFGYETVNVDAQQRDPTRCSSWFQRALLDPAGVPGVRHRHVPPTSTPASGRCSPSSTTRRPARCLP